MAQFLRYGHAFKNQMCRLCDFDLSRSNCFGELIRTYYVSRKLILTFTNVVKGPIFKFGFQIEIFADIDLDIARDTKKTVVSHSKENDPSTKWRLCHTNIFINIKNKSIKWLSALLCVWKLTFDLSRPHSIYGMIVSYDA